MRSFAADRWSATLKDDTGGERVPRAVILSRADGELCYSQDTRGGAKNLAGITHKSKFEHITRPKNKKQKNYKKV